jgi:predicted metalloendopeptidase
MGIAASVARFGVAVSLVAALAFADQRSHAQAAAPIGEPFTPSAMDTTKSACKNFFAYADGGWLHAHPIPPAYSEYGYIEALVDETRAIVRATLEKAEAHPGTPGGETQQIGTFYATCMNTATVERRGLAPLAPAFARIAAIRTRAQLAASFAPLHDIGADVGYSVSPTQDFKNSAHVIAEIDQSGIGLPERDYYTRTDAESRRVFALYRKHVATQMALAGDASATADAAAIVAFETQLARASVRAADLRDPAAVYHPMTTAQIDALAPHLRFAAYLAAANVPTSGIVNVSEPGFVRALDRAIVTVPLSTWRAYLRWHVVQAYAPELPARFANQAFAFYGKTLGGQKVQLPRWKRCVNEANVYLGEAVGRAYVATSFSPEDKQRALDMTLRVRAAYDAEIAALPWMTAKTKTIAEAKLAAMGLKVGYPDRWRSYAGYRVAPGAFAANVLRGRAFDRAYQLAKIDKPLDKTQWSMTPQTVNAYNDTLRNEIVLPAAQLQLPYFAADAPLEDNLGATGAGTIGHEMTHGFDDEGHKFDLHGNLRNWWTPADLAKFDARAHCVIKQFDDAAAVGNVHYQGRLVSGEAIADLGGVVIGYRALETALGTGSRAPIDGFTPEQRYFLAYAQSWTEAVRPEAARREALGDPHPLPRDRVNLTLANVPEWYAAFDCPKPPKPVCSVW